MLPFLMHYVLLLDYNIGTTFPRYHSIRHTRLYLVSARIIISYLRPYYHNI